MCSTRVEGWLRVSAEEGREAGQCLGVLGICQADSEGTPAMAVLHCVTLRLVAWLLPSVDGRQRDKIRKLFYKLSIYPALQSFAAVIQRYMTMDQASKDGRQALLTMASKPCMREVRRQPLPAESASHCLAVSAGRCMQQ